jgi:predicted RNase H-like nuclease (RuvC/YqgF family)
MEAFHEAEAEIVKLRTEVEQLRARVSHLVKLLDDQHGTPCEQIRHQQEVEELRAENDRLRQVAMQNYGLR